MSNHAVMPLRDYINTCDKVRELTDITDVIKSGELPDKVSEVYEAGKQKEWSDFWDSFQQNGTRTNYDYACYQIVGNGSAYPFWSDANFKPKYSIRPKSANRGFGGMAVTDFAKILEDRGIELDTSQCTILNTMFAKCNLCKRLPTLDLSSATTISAMVAYTYNLRKIDKIIWSETITTASGPFEGAASLKEFVSEGTLAISMSFKNSPLNIETMTGVIRCLKNFSGTDEEFTRKITFSSACLTALEAEGATSPNGNSWTQYIEDLGWLYS